MTEERRFKSNETKTRKPELIVAQRSKKRSNEIFASMGAVLFGINVS